MGFWRHPIIYFFGKKREYGDPKINVKSNYLSVIGVKSVPHPKLRSMTIIKRKVQLTH